MKYSVLLLLVVFLTGCGARINPAAPFTSSNGSISGSSSSSSSSSINGLDHRLRFHRLNFNRLRFGIARSEPDASAADL
jgi:hypothetical protein